MTAIIDYGAGNLRSVQKACEFEGAQADITSAPNAIAAADHVILPGVGAFGDCMISLRRNVLTDVIHQVTERGTPFLGICLGMQIAAIAFARGVLGFEDANSAEFAPDSKHPVIALMEEQMDYIIGM